ncbi:antirestriction protein ArdA [Trueperella pyogenes]|uniref:antirestriction protein ArdA n=1 Tax=Trueperella pyogenes TaxID=1661 RepID=UPI00345CA10E
MSNALNFAKPRTSTLPCSSNFEDAYQGQWDSFTEYAQQLVEDVGMFEGWSEEAQRYFDWDAWTRDLAFDYMVVHVPAGDVFCLLTELGMFNMDALKIAREYVAAFHIHREFASLSQGEIELRDLTLLRDAVELEIATHVNELVTFEAMSWTVVTDALTSLPEALKLRYGRGPGETSE